MIGHTTLSSLPRLRAYKSRRASSFDVQGNNSDWWTIEPGEGRVLLSTDKPGCVKHIWMTVGNDDLFPRKMVLKAWWDDEPEPSIEVPIGDFFGIGHCLFKDFMSLPLQMSPQDGRGMNCWWPMPFDKAKIAVFSECGNAVNLYFYIDYEEYSSRHDPDIGRFHAQWRREAQTEGWLTETLNSENLWDIWSRKPNTTGADNYVLLDAEGSGVYVGCNLNIDVFEKQGNDWYGEGDDMIFVDGEPWPPALHGTGTEDYFNMAFCPRTEYCAPYHGLTLYSGNSEWPWSGKNSMYRYHIEDPVRFEKSILVTIEHGHANKLSNDYSSTAYWYQTEPHKPFPRLLPVEQRMPRG